MNTLFFRGASSRRIGFASKSGWWCAVLLVACAAFLPSIAPAQAHVSGAHLFVQDFQLQGDPNPGEYFGAKLAAQGDTLVVGTSSNKRVYVYARDANGAWALQQKFTVNYHDQTYGYLAVSGDTLVAGGIIYVRSGGVWTEQQALDITNSDPRFALQGDTLVMGNPYPTQPSQNQDGNVEVFVRSGSTWTQQATLTAPFLSRENMGYSVALDGDTLVAGIFRASSGPGGAYVFVRSGSTWTQQDRLVLPTGASWMRVAVEGDTAAIGDPGNNQIHIFTRSGTTWSLAQTLFLPANGGNYLGDKIAISGGIIAASAESQFHLFSRTLSGWILAESFAWPGNRFPEVALANRGKLFVQSDMFSNNTTSAGGFVVTHSVPPPPAPGSGWRDYDVGSVGVAGSSSDSGAAVTVSGSGADIWEREDAFHFRSESLTGDGAIIARVDSAGSGHPWSKLGLMAREDVAPAARNVMALVTPGDHLGTQIRGATADTTGFQDAGWLGAPIWLMLARSGNLFASYRSTDGDNWTPIGSAVVNMPPTIHVGLAVSSHDNAALNTGAFSGIEIVSTEPPPPGLNPPSNLTGAVVNGTYVNLQWADNSSNESGFVIERATGAGSTDFVVIKSVGENVTEYTDTSPQPNTTYTYRVRAEHFSDPRSAPSNSFTVTTTERPPEALDGTDLGTVGVPGSYGSSSGVITIDASGTDIWESHDSGYFAYKQVSGDFDVRVLVSSLVNTHPWAKAGLMARERLEDYAMNAFTLVTADNVAGFQYRNSLGSSTSFVAGPWVRAPYWVRLVRSNTTFTSMISPDGVAWQTVGSTNMTLPPLMYVGLAVTSHDNTRTTRATFSNLQFGP